MVVAFNILGTAAKFGKSQLWKLTLLKLVSYLTVMSFPKTLLGVIIGAVFHALLETEPWEFRVLVLVCNYDHPPMLVSWLLFHWQRKL